MPPMLRLTPHGRAADEDGGRSGRASSASYEAPSGYSGVTVEQVRVKSPAEDAPDPSRLSLALLHRVTWSGGPDGPDQSAREPVVRRVSPTGPLAYSRAVAMTDDESPLPGRLRLMWDEGCRWPLWREDGQDSSESAYIHGVLRLSASLVQDLEAWAARAEFLLGSSTTPGASSRPWTRAETLDEWAESLVERLENQLPPGVSVRYQR